MSHNSALARQALQWRKSHLGGRLCVWWPAGSVPGDDSHPILAMHWDGGGVGELGTFYRREDAEAMQTICDIFNWALEELAPSETDWYGTRTYLSDETEVPE
jgi:hypothetical protein